MVTPLPLRLEDATAERVRRSHEAALLELQRLPSSGTAILAGVTLADGVATTIAHRLGRAPSMVTVSVPRGATSAGYVVETRGSEQDLTKVIVLTANGYGATITVDVAVTP